MVSKNILAVIVIVAVLVIGGGIYMMQQPTPTTTPTPTTPEPAATTPTPTTQETPTTTSTPTPTEAPKETYPGPTLPAGTDEEQVEALVMAYIDAFDRHAAEEIAGCFTEDGLYLPEYTGASANGQEKIKENLQEFFTKNPAVMHKELTIKRLSINGDNANVIIEYKLEQSSVSNIAQEETITVVRVDDSWRIQKAYIKYAG
jgi:uncharacterized protein (TIGR02246 family)